VNLKSCALAQLAVDPDVAAVLFDNAKHGREAQPGAMPPLFGGKKRLKDALLRFGGHALAGIADRQPDIRPRRYTGVFGHISLIQPYLRRFQGQPAAIGHSIAGIDHQIQQHLLKLPRVSLNDGQVSRQVCFQADMLPNQPSEHFLKLKHHLIEVNQFHFQHLPPAEGQDLPG